MDAYVITGDEMQIGLDGDELTTQFATFHTIFEDLRRDGGYLMNQFR